MSNLNRRFFIKKTCLTAAALSSGFHANKNSFAQDRVDLAVVQGKPELSIQHAFKLLGGIDKFVSSGDTVLLKPNVSFPSHESIGATTNPAIVTAIADVVIKAGAKRVFISDHSMRNPERCFQKCGIESAIEGMEKVKLISLDNESLYEIVHVPNGAALKEVKVTKLLQRCDLVINIPCAKSHVATDVSFGIKNLMGLIWDREFFHTGTDLHTAIAELATVIKPDLTILDASRLLLTNGPTGPGKLQELSTVVAGRDVLAVDSFATTLGNWNNRTTTAPSVKHLAHAAKLGVGELDIEKLNVSEISI